MDSKQFERTVETALADIPRRFKKHFKNISVMVEDSSPYGDSLLGLYHGVPLQHRGASYGNFPPDVIIIYKKPIENLCRTEEEMIDKIREVVLHEVGHYFGLDEKTLRDIESHPKGSKSRK